MSTTTETVSQETIEQVGTLYAVFFTLNKLVKERQPEMASPRLRLHPDGSGAIDHLAFLIGTLRPRAS